MAVRTGVGAILGVGVRVGVTVRLGVSVAVIRPSSTARMYWLVASIASCVASIDSKVGTYQVGVGVGSGVGSGVGVAVGGIGVGVGLDEGTGLGVGLGVGTALGLGVGVGLGLGVGSWVALARGAIGSSFPPRVNTRAVTARAQIKPATARSLSIPPPCPLSIGGSPRVVPKPVGGLPTLLACGAGVAWTAGALVVVLGTGGLLGAACWLAPSSAAPERSRTP